MLCFQLLLIGCRICYWLQVLLDMAFLQVLFKFTRRWSKPHLFSFWVTICPRTRSHILHQKRNFYQCCGMLNACWTYQCTITIFFAVHTRSYIGPTWLRQISCRYALSRIPQITNGLHIESFQFTWKMMSPIHLVVTSHIISATVTMRLYN